MFSDNIQHQIREPLKVLLITNKQRLLMKGKFTGRELSTFVGRKVITTPLDTNENIVKTGKLVVITKMVISLDKLDNTDNLETGRLSSVLIRYYVTDSEEFTNFEPVTSQYKKLKDWELIPLL